MKNMSNEIQRIIRIIEKKNDELIQDINSNQDNEQLRRYLLGRSDGLDLAVNLIKANCVCE